MSTRKYIPILIAIALLVLFSAFTKSNDIFVRFLQKKLTEYNLYYPAEKAYLHTDKTFYKPGDDIWIGGYLADGITHKPSDISTIIYIELIDPKGATLKKQMFKVLEGKCKAHFLLPEEAPGGLYKLKAYTKWMLNFGDKMIFEKKLQVQKIIKLKILSKLDFAKEAYGASDTVLAKLNMRDLSNTPIVNKQFSFIVRLKGRTYYKGSAISNEEGNADIKFVLPDKLNSADGVLNVVLNHRGQSESISGAIPIVLNKIDLQFFPEGGDAVETLPCKMAFKALNEFGKPADVEGEIIDSKGKLITQFKSFHQGMGAFNFVPDSNQTYSAKILKPSGITRLYNLSKIKAEGCVLHLKERKENEYIFSLHSNIQEKVHIVVQLRGQILFSETKQLKRGEFEQRINIERSDITGIAQITIFDDFERPLAERLFYVFPENKLNIQISANKQDYAPREKVEMEMKVSDADGNPVQGNFSLAVVDDKIITFADDKQDNILSNLLLSSDLKGEIYEPSFYFDPEEEKAEEALDYLLLTQGWRRFAWKDILQLHKRNVQEAESFDKVLGQITNSAGKGVRARVVIVDDKQKKFVKLETNEGGRFAVPNFYDYKYLQIYARSLDRKNKRVQIKISRVSANTHYKVDNSNVGFGTINIDPVLAETRKVNNSITMDTEVVREEEVLEDLAITRSVQNQSSAVWTMEEDAVGLEEVVAIGYGTQKKSELTGAVVSVQTNELTNLADDVGYALQGTVSGVQVVNSSGTPGTSSSIMIRGASSTSANSEPLFIVDGVPVTNLSQINSNDVKKVDVLKSAASTAIYGSRGANGVVVITTKKGEYGSYYRTAKLGRELAQTKLYNSYSFKPVKEFYVPKYSSKETVKEDLDKRETIYWNPSIITDKKGKAKVEFYNSDEVTTFRSIAEGIGYNGQVGRAEFYHTVQKTLSLQAKIPPYLICEDVLEIPLLITNNTNETIAGDLNIKLPSTWQSVNQPPKQVKIAAKDFKEISIRIKVGAQIGKHQLNISFNNKDYKEQYVGNTQVVSKGFPAEMSYSAKALYAKFSFDLSTVINNSSQMSISIYNNVLAEVMDGIESVIRQPHGCFEQVSASTYPNILILKYLMETKEVDAELKQKTLNYIQAGYKKLAGYETKQHGFEWFGKTPPHEGLTAFGLMEFHDMKEVFSGVDETMLKRTRDWLLSRRDGKGGFKINAGKYGFSGASKEVTNAYLVYTFSEVGMDKSLYQEEYQKAWKEALKSKDAYRVALMANACLNLKDEAKANVLVQHIAQRLAKGDVEKLKAEHSIVRSWGKSLNVEVAALSAMALMKNGDENFKELLALMDYIFGARSFGGFGSTQATVLSLKAITQYASIVNKMPEKGNVTLIINGKEILERDISSNDKVVVLDDLEQYLSKGVQTFELKFNGIKNPLSFTANAEWMQALPASSDLCKVRLQTQLMENKCEINDLVRMSTCLVNKTNHGLPMTIAMVGLPSGLSAQPWQLKKMQEEHVFDYYEIHKNYVVFYFTELAPNAQQKINLDLKADVPGIYAAPASCTYLYYNKEHKDWCKGEEIKISKP